MRYNFTKKSFWFGLEPPMRRSPSSVQQQVCAKCYPDRLRFGSTRAKNLFWSKNRERPLSFCLAVNNYFKKTTKFKSNVLKAFIKLKLKHSKNHFFYSSLYLPCLQLYWYLKLHSKQPVKQDAYVYTKTHASSYVVVFALIRQAQATLAMRAFKVMR